MENPSLAHDIGQYILQLLPHEKLKSCRLVNSSMKQLIDNPNFWIEKFKREKNMSNENVTKWIKFIREDVRNFFLGGRSKTDISTYFEILQKSKFLPFIRQIFGGAVAPPLASSLPV